MIDLSGLTILVVEDEPIVAMCLEDMLADLGCTVVGPAATVAEGLAEARGAVLDAAILDINLGEATSYPIASVLADRAVPIVFATGYARADPPEAIRAELIGKPYSREDIVAALGRALAG
ncbi:response regulator [Sphingomonas sp.]|uniref:response regulator n=1 Tax=Sphingomonas sp. TaxID=28214 RepID=UPI002DD69DCC|nr:response regulator [Sphingomonas sp.]